jgi:hypothetical protein
LVRIIISILNPYTHDSPWRIVDDIGGAFALGAIGGGIWHGFKGAKNSPIVSHRHDIK